MSQLKAKACKIHVLLNGVWIFGCIGIKVLLIVNVENDID